MSTEVEIPALGALEQALDAFPSLVRPEMERAGDAALKSLIPDLADYPPAPASSSYRRTGTEGRLWTSAEPAFAAQSSGFEARLGNATPYGPLVQGSPDETPHQTRRHAQTGWNRTDQVVEKHKAAINTYFDAALARVAQKIEESV